VFFDRKQAARKLANLFRGQHLENLLILGIPCGGVVVAAEMSSELKGELDVVLSQKLTDPSRKENVIGAVCEEGEEHLTDYGKQFIGTLELEREIRSRRREIERLQGLFREGRPLESVVGRTVIVTDDGMTTGSTMHAALQTLRAQQPKELIAAVPVGPKGTVETLQALCDDFVCLEVNTDFKEVEQFYVHFAPVSEIEVSQILSTFSQKRRMA